MLDFFFQSSSLGTLKNVPRLAFTSTDEQKFWTEQSKYYIETEPKKSAQGIKKIALTRK